MAVRRIHIATLALGLVGVLGFTFVQGAAQPAPSGFAVGKAADKAKDSAPPVQVALPEPMPDLVLPPMPPAQGSKPEVAPVAAPALPPLPMVKPPAAAKPEPNDLDLKPIAPPAPAKPEPKPDVVIPVAPSEMPPAIVPSSIASNRVAPGLSIETIVPDAVPLGKDVTYEIVVRNTGPVPVSGVRVDEDVPAGGRYL